MSIHSLDGVTQIALEASRDGVVIFDEAGAILLLNRQIERTFGYSRTELLGAAIDLLLPGRPRGPQAAECRELNGRRKDGSGVPVEVRLTRTVAEGATLVIASVTDLTVPRRRQEEQAAELARQREELQGALADVERLRDQLARENVQLRNEVRTLRGPRHVAAESAAARAVLSQVESVAQTPATVLLLGETGCGKEVFAQAIHAASDRRDRPMVRVNCAAIPTPLMESELFGRERGAYTGALSRQIGRFELADGATLFLDEIGDLALEAQAKLLRVIQDKVVERLGSTRTIAVDVRIIAATNRDLRKAVAGGSFREDLYYRLNVFPITVPPLRERIEDIPVLVWTFVDEFARTFNKKIESIARADLEALQRYPWPGNVRELRNVIERAVIVAKGPRLSVGPPGTDAIAPRESAALADVEASHIRSILERAGWRVRGRGGAAALLGLKPTTLDSRMVKLGIRRPGR